jgi:hypothetical protein
MIHDGHSPSSYAMLTLAKIQTYDRFDGDMDGYSRARGGGDTSGITDADWRTIERLLQAVYLIEARLAAEAFCIQTEEELQAVTANEQAREALRRLARRLS